MISARVAIVLWWTVTVVDAREGVTFERKYTADPCRDKILVFVTLWSTAAQFDHAFRLRCTNALFALRGTSQAPLWNAAKGLELSIEISFFHRQVEMITEGFRPLLERSVPVEPVYEFDPVTGGYVFQLYIDGQLACLCASGKVDYYPGYHSLDEAMKKQVDRYNRGVGLDALKASAKTLELKWQNFCFFVQAVENNATDRYLLFYDEGKGGLVCSVRSKSPWRHLVLFGQIPSSKMSRSYDEETGEYLTVGFQRHDGRARAVCNITSPNGMIALQTFEMQIPTTTLPPVETTVLFSTPSVDDDGSFDSRVGVATVVVPVVLVVVAILGIGLGLFVFRDRVERVVARFQRASTEGRVTSRSV